MHFDNFDNTQETFISALFFCFAKFNFNFRLLPYFLVVLIVLMLSF